MQNQASSLDKEFSHPKYSQLNNSYSARSICVTGGKGGVGKSNISLNVSIQLAQRGRKVLLMDADFGLANIDILLGVKPVHTLEEVLAKKATIEDIIIHSDTGIDFLPGSSGIPEMANLTIDEQKFLILELAKLQRMYDFFIIDTGAGISNNVLRLNASVDDIWIIATPEPTSLTDAYAMMKVLSTQHQISHFKLIANQTTEKGGKNIYELLSKVASQAQTAINIFYFGYVSDNKKIVQDAMKLRKPVSIAFPHSHVTKCYRDIADTMLYYPHKKKMGIKQENLWIKWFQAIIKSE